MTAAPYVLAKTMADAHRFAQDELGLKRGRYRIVTSPSTVKGIQGADLHLVPGWETRFDRFAMKSALRWTRLNKIDHCQAEEPDGLEPAGVQLTLITDATDFLTGSRLSAEEIAELESRLEPEGWEPPDSLSAEQVLRLAANPDAKGAEVLEEKPRRTRRRRCDDCGLLVNPADWDEHQSEHLPEDV